ncbi:phosphoglycerate mutase, partial [Pyrenophora tritici-repentis]
MGNRPGGGPTPRNEGFREGSVVVAEDRLRQGARVVFQQPPAARALAEDGPAAVTEAAQRLPGAGVQPEQPPDGGADGAPWLTTTSVPPSGSRSAWSRTTGAARSATSVSSSPPPRRTGSPRFQAAYCSPYRSLISSCVRPCQAPA